jgi:hypothetical protein
VNVLVRVRQVTHVGDIGAAWRARAPTSAPCSDVGESIARAEAHRVQLIVSQAFQYDGDQSHGAHRQHCVAGLLRHTTP